MSSSRSDERSPLACGLYRTTRALPGNEATVTAGLLVRYHNHSEKGPPIVLLPASNEANTWRFHQQGFLVQDDTYPETLSPLLPQGIYRLREHVHLEDGRVVAANALAQLGYDRHAGPILFFPTRRDGENALVFPERGIRVSAEIFALLERIDTRGPRQPARLH